MKPCLIYDDREPVSPEITALLGVDRFSQVLYRKRSLLDHARALMHDVGISEFVHLTRTDDLDALKSQLDRAAPGQRFLYFPSHVVPQRLDAARVFLAKIQHSRLDLIVPVDPQPHDPNLAPVLLCDDRFLREALPDIARRDFAPLHRLSRAGRSPSSRRLAPVAGAATLRDISRYQRFVEFLSSNFDVRHFNAIENDALTVTKRSSDVAKMRREFTFMQLVDGPMRAYFLRPFDLEQGERSASYKLERLNYPDMAIQWVHGALSPREFEALLDSVERYIGARPTRPVEQPKIDALAEDLYVGKTERRLRDLEQSPVYPTIASLLERSTTLGSIRAQFERFKSLWARRPKTRGTPHLAFTHGDLCFSNILYEKRIAQIKFVDPRGADTPDELFSHPLYDLAKLSHSVLGNYDFINHGLFELVFDRDLKLSLEMTSGIDLSRHKRSFVARLERMGFDPRLVRLCEASLFLSMIPLHVDVPKKTVAFALNAASIMDDLEHA